MMGLKNGDCQTVTLMLIARLAILNETLAHRTFLVGERLSLADLAMAITLVSAFRWRDLLVSLLEILNLLLQQELRRYVLDEEWRSRHRHLVRWWNTVLHQVISITFVAFYPKREA